MPEHQKPSIGRIVHYTNLGDKDGKYPPEVQAAIITGVYRELHGTAAQIEGHLHAANKLGDTPDSMFADIRIFYRTGEFLMQKVPFAVEPTRGHWNWPPRV